MRGRYAFQWSLEGETLKVKATVPLNGKANVLLPEFSKEVGSGEHTFHVP